MKAYEFYGTWKEYEAKTGKATTPEAIRQALLENFPVRVWTLEDIRYSEKALAYTGKFRLTIGERYTTLLLSNDVGRFLLEHIGKRFDSIGLKLSDDRVVDCVLIYVK